MSLFFEITSLICIEDSAYDFSALIKIMIISHDSKSASFFEWL